MADTPAKTIRTVDITPTWKGVLPLLLCAYRDGTEQGRAMALEELRRMAEVADAAVTASKAEGQ